jgi:hypothetical protein
MRYPGFIYGSARSQSWLADIETTMNFYPEQSVSRDATSPSQLYPTPGGRFFAETATDVNMRGGVVAGQRAFVVVGAGFYEVPSVGGTLTKLGTVAVDRYPATLSYNGATGGQVFVTSGGSGYTFALATNVLTQVLTNEATMGGMLDGYFLAFNVLNGKVRISRLNDGLTWDPNDFFQRTIRPDPWQAMTVVGGKIWLIGSAPAKSGTTRAPYRFRFSRTWVRLSTSASSRRFRWRSRATRSLGSVARRTVQASSCAPSAISRSGFLTTESKPRWPRFSATASSLIAKRSRTRIKGMASACSIFRLPMRHVGHVDDALHQRGSWNSAPINSTAVPARDPLHVWQAFGGRQ